MAICNFLSRPIQYTPFPLMRYSALMHFLRRPMIDGKPFGSAAYDVSKAISANLPPLLARTASVLWFAGIGSRC